jgi:hypothetical protein
MSSTDADVDLAEVRASGGSRTIPNVTDRRRDPGPVTVPLPSSHREVSHMCPSWV